MAELLVDSHCHIPLMDNDVSAVLASAREHQVGHMLCVAVDLETWPPILQLAEQHENIFASVGIHPNTTLESEVDSKTLAGHARHERVIAIGETGLDYYRSEGDLDWQRERFRQHIDAAKQVDKPVIIHSRNASHDMIEIMQQENIRDVGGVMHCFVDDWDTAKKAMDMNFYISFSGIVTFKNATEVQDVARKVPLDRLLVETDSPYLAPVPYRGKPNQPANVYFVAKFLAELRQEDYASIAQHTTDNFFNLFKTAIKIN